MIISLVVATDLDGVIGRDGRLPWHLPADLQRFKSITMGKPMIMGRRTWESIGKALPGRRSIVLTRRDGFEAPGAVVVDSPQAALERAAPATEVMVIGGAEVFREFLARATRIYWTQVQARVGGDVRFPTIDLGAWNEVACEERPADERHAHALRFLVMERKGATSGRHPPAP